MQTFGNRRLIFGLVAIGCVTAVQVTSGWTAWGFAAMGSVNLLFYGERAITAMAELVSKVKEVLKERNE